MVVLDGTIVNVALPHIQNALAFSAARACQRPGIPGVRQPAIR
jgi:hypothetical protein